MHKFKYLASLCKSFSFLYMVSQLALIVTDHLGWFIPSLYRWRNSYIRQLIEELADEYAIQPKVEGSEVYAPSQIWTMWQQGLDQAPSVVAYCIQSMRRQGNVVVLDEKNLINYIDVPPVIRSKVGAAISYTHFSDYVRFAVLARHGGLWLDATVLCTGPIPMEAYEMPFYTFRQRAAPNVKMANSWWKGYIQGTDGSSGIFEFCRCLLEAYWAKYNILVDYFLIDHLLSYALSLPEYAGYSNDIPWVDRSIYWLEHHYTDVWRDEDEDKIPNMSKLSYKTMDVENVSSDSVWVHVLHDHVL